MRLNRRLLANLTVAAAAGVCFQVPGCSIGSVRGIITGFNVCNTIVVCDPRVYDFVTSGYDGPGVDPEVDPFCTFPPFCTLANDPIYGGLVVP